MEKDQPCYFCIITSVLLTVAMLMLTVRAGLWVAGRGKQIIANHS